MTPAIEKQLSVLNYLLQRRITAFARCYNAQLFDVDSPRTRTVEVMAGFELGADGLFSKARAQSEGGEEAFAPCVAGVISRLRLREADTPGLYSATLRMTLTGTPRAVPTGPGTNNWGFDWGI